MQDMEAVYQQHAQAVYRYLYCLTEDASLAEELTQETFYQAVRTAGRFRGECKVSVWLCQIAKHCWYRELKRRKRGPDLPLEELELSGSPSNGPEQQAEAKAQKIALFRRMHQLEPIVREVIYLRLAGELSFSEIGAILEKNETWARVTFYRGKKKLLEIYDRMVSCAVTQDLLPGYAEGLTSSETSREIEAHLASCAGCRAALEVMKASPYPQQADPIPIKKLHPFRRVRRRYLLSAVTVAVAVGLVVTVTLAVLTGSVRIPLSAGELELPVTEQNGEVKIGFEIKDRNPLGHYAYYSTGAEDGARYITIYWVFGFHHGEYPRASYMNGSAPIYYGTGPEDENRVLLWSP